MEKLEKAKREYYTNESTFRVPQDSIHFFSRSNHNIGMHKQEFFEINIVTRGEGKHFIGENVLTAEEGDVFIIPPNVEHGYKGNPGFDVYHILVNNSYIQKNFADLQAIKGFSILFNVEPIVRERLGKPLHLKLTSKQFESIEGLLFDRRNEDVFVSTENAFINIGSFLIIVTKLCQFYTENTANLIKESEIQDTTFMRSLALIHEKYNEKLTIEMLAKEARLSKSTFMRRFLRVCKLSPAEYITIKRIEIAENMLKNTKNSISEIAEKIGFYDSAHFSKTFNKYHGCSPLEYRKGNDNKKNTK